MNFLFEIIPLLIFYISFKFFNLTLAAIIFSVSSLISNFLQYVLYKKISYINLFGTILIIIFSAISYFTNDSSFIKIKPTIINLILSVTLLYGYIIDKPFVSYIMPKHMTLNNEIMLKLSRNFGLLFLFLAILNEVIWRNFSDDVWIKFKVFGIFAATFVFLLINYNLLKKISSSENELK